MSDEPLSLDAAISLLSAGDEPEREDNAAPAEAVDAASEPEATEQPSEAEPTADGEIDPEEVIDLALEDEGATPEDPEKVIPAVPMPKSWAADDGDVWKSLTPEAQAKVLARETERDASTQKAVQSAAEARKAAETELKGVTELKAATAQVLQRAGEIFKGKWTNDTPEGWAELAKTDPAQYVQLRAEYDAERAELTRIQAVNQQQAALADAAFQKARIEGIKELMPELLDPDKGKARVSEIETYITDVIKADPSILHTLDASVILAVSKAMKYDAAVAKARAKATTTPAPVRAAVRPTAAQPVRSPQRAAIEAKARFDKTLSLDDALAVLSQRK